MAGWLADGTVSTTRRCVDGLESAPQAFMMLRGGNIGKMLVRL